MDVEQCKDCMGSGELLGEDQFGHQIWYECPECEGKGEVKTMTEQPVANKEALDFGKTEQELERIEKRYNEYWESPEIDIDIANTLVDELPSLIAEIRRLREENERLENKERIYDVTDEWVREQSKKVKHLFPLENVAGYGQLCDKVLEMEKQNAELAEVLRYCADPDAEKSAGERRFKAREVLRKYGLEEGQ